MTGFCPLEKFDITPVKTLGGSTFTRVGRPLLFAVFLAGPVFLFDSNSALLAQETPPYQKIIGMDQDILLAQMQTDPDGLAAMLNAIEPE